jgi:hypothetical protein
MVRPLRELVFGGQHGLYQQVVVKQVSRVLGELVKPAALHVRARGRFQQVVIRRVLQLGALDGMVYGAQYFFHFLDARSFCLPGLNAFSHGLFFC